MQEPTFEKLKVAWIDDRPGNIPVKTFSQSIKRYFEIIPMTDLDRLVEVAGGAPDDLDSDTSQFDVVATDFNLVPENKREAVSERILEAGLDAPAAGFLVGLLLSLAKPGTPKAIFPYSGDQRQFSEVWKLGRTFSPWWVSVAPPTSSSKLAGAPSEVFLEMASAYRESLAIHLKTGSCAVSDASERYLESLSSSPDSDIDADTVLRIRFPEKERLLPVGALFYDFVDQSTLRIGPAKKIYDFFEQSIERNPKHKEVERLSERYWNESNQLQSLLTYANSADNNFVSKPDLLSNFGENEKDDLARAFLFICIRSYVSTKCIIDLLEQVSASTLIDDDAALSVEEIRRFAIEEMKLAPENEMFWELFDEAIAAVEKLNHYASNLDQILDSVTDEGSKTIWDWEARIVRALDPNPKSITVNLAGSQRVGRAVAKALSRHLEKQNFTAARHLIAGKFVLSKHDAAIAKRYARRMIPTEFPWPSFLHTER